MTAIQIDVRRDNLQELDLGVTVTVGFSAPGCECTIRPSGPSWTWGKRLVDAKKNANNTSANALLYLR